MDAGGPPPSYHESRVKSDDAREPPTHEDGPPMKAQKQDATSYPGKAASQASIPQYNTIDFLGNVSGGPHAAAAEALATFSSSVGETANNSNLFVNVPPPTQGQTETQPTPAQAPTQAASSTPQHGPPFLCPTCNTSYSRLEYLRRHERRHADIRPFACPCGKSFSRSDVLARHKTKCRVVLSGEGQAAASSDNRAKTERTPRSTPRSTKGRTSSQMRTRNDRDAVADLSVDPALSAAAVDPSIQPPPPLEGGAPAGEADESYSYNTAPPSYAGHSTNHAEGDYTHAKGGAAHYTGMPMNAHAQMPTRMHDSKMYAHGVSGTSRNANMPYISGTAAIHPELSSRGQGMYSGTHSSSGANSPSTGTGTASSAAYYPSQHTGAEHTGTYAPGTNAAHTAGHYSEANGSAPVAGMYQHPHGKDLGRFSSGTLSPFSNTALSSNISPYLSAFSCARDMPRMSSPRMGSSSNTSQSGSVPPPPPTTGTSQGEEPESEAPQ
ncbi:RNA polymerase II transcription regulator [Malassezia pachydermatis]|uniref:Putative zinc finger protein n=1 Tax=Malassezia pachydermatis TaxID=77020 RepID=A0A0M8MPZ2_9BASI|nr:putative zinc finger protein [Malassezia pachydermatis]KOS15998.1 putative zinc finger protein [Malassezia pachydermatis]